MEDEPRWSNGSIATFALWAFTLFVLVCSWSLWAVVGADIHHLPILFGESACVLSAAAAVAQIRCYVARVCRLLRITAGLQHPDATVREFSPRR